MRCIAWDLMKFMIPAFSADLTIMEETAEFLNRIEKGEKLPLLTSCCPAWVKFITDQYKDYIPNHFYLQIPTGNDVCGY